MICGAIRHWLQRCVCGRGSGRDGDRALQKVTIRQTDRDRERAPSRDFYWEKRTPENTLHHRRNASFDQGDLAHLGPDACAAFTGLKTLSPLFHFSGCFHVPQAVSHFEPVSNGGPGTDLPTEECVLLLIHRTSRSFCPPATEVRRHGGEAERGVPGWLPDRLAGWERSWGRIQCGKLEFSGKNKRHVRVKEAESSTVPIWSMLSCFLNFEFWRRDQRHGVALWRAECVYVSMN